MRLFILLAAAAVAVLNATMNKLQLDGFPDGTHITFWFWHVKNENYQDDNLTPGALRDYKERQDISLKFYEDSAKDFSQFTSKDMLAMIRIDRSDDYPVLTFSSDFADQNKRPPLFGSYKEWIDSPQTPKDTMAVEDGWWRVDVYKHDKTHLSVFFQGFWAEIRTFNKPLDNIKAIYAISNFVDHDKFMIFVKTPNTNIDYKFLNSIEMTHDFLTNQKNKNNFYIAFEKMLVNHNIEMTAVLKSAYPSSSSTWTASLEFFAITGPPNYSPLLERIIPDEERYGTSEATPFLRIVQIYDDRQKNNQILFITDQVDFDYKKYKGQGSTKELGACADDYPFTPQGDLQHLLLERDSETTLKLSVFFKKTKPYSAMSCTFQLSSAVATRLNGPFKIISNNGGLILHLETNTPLREKQINSQSAN